MLFHKFSLFFLSTIFTNAVVATQGTIEVPQICLLVTSPNQLDTNLLNKLSNQNYTNWKLYCFSSATPEVTANQNSSPLPNNVTLIPKNAAIPKAIQIYSLINTLDDNDIVVCLDTDLKTKLDNKDTLTTIANEYKDPATWMIYNAAEFRNNTDLKFGNVSFYAWTFKTIRLEVLLENGQLASSPKLENKLITALLNTCLPDHAKVYSYSSNFQQKLVQDASKHALIAKPNAIKSKKADLIVYSYDRPLQLYAFLESVDSLVTGIEKTFIIYKVSNENFEKAYDEVQQNFPNAIFLKQEQEHDATTFKALTVRAFNNPSPYFLLGVDDIIITEPINVEHCIDALNRTKAYGFFLRLGKNITECYMENREVALPPLVAVDEDIHAWQFNASQADWHAANAFDMALYLKQDMHNAFETLEYKAPHSLQSTWGYEADLNRVGLCYSHSKMINIPLNLVQTECPDVSRNMALYSAEELLGKFNQGLKIDIKQFAYINNKGAHSEYIPHFIPRT